MNLSGKHILITGAGGFIGGRLAERLIEEEGAHVRAMVRASRVGAKHFPNQESQTVQLGTRDSNLSNNRVSENASPVQGDITDMDAVRRAVEGCDIVVHCAAMQGMRGRLQDFRRVNVGGTLNLLRAAKDANVARFIHISTINVHGYPPPLGASADSPLVFHGDFYSISKAEGERAAREFSATHHLPITVIRPACTYGPHSTAWTLNPLRRIQRGSPVLIGGGEGICNAIYIDNLVDLILLAMKNDAAIGQAFIGAEGRGVTWREFFGAYARMGGVKRMRSIPRTVAFLIATAAEMAAKPTGRSPFVSRASIEFLTHRVVYDIDKSKRVLRYAPRISFEEGMRKTETWLRANHQLSTTPRQ